ncbi:MAG TPA: hypothetical protein DCG22_00915 [Bacteroidetes bacterium]|nr:hypothetical protein [Bacteroidota bacterium]
MRRLTLIFALVVAVTGIRAQGGPPPDDERAEALRIAFLTNYLSLTPDESKVFWPVYNSMRDEVKVIMESRRDKMERSDFTKMTDEQLKQYLDNYFQSEQQLLDIRKRYAGQFSQVLPMQKVAMLTGAEEAFKRELLRHARDRRDGPPDGADRMPGGRSDGPPPHPGY